MILVNQQELPLNNPPKDHPLKAHSNQYHEILRGLKEQFPKGTVLLQRRGWPRQNKETGMLEPCPMMTIPLQINVEGENGQAVWAYCEGQPIILANGLREIDPQRRSMMVGEQISIELNKKPDLAVYLFQTKFVKQDFYVLDPEGDQLRAALQRQSEIELANAIWTGIASEVKLKMIASAWGIPNANTTESVVLRKLLEERILSLEKEKRKFPEDVTRKGIAAFLREVKADDDVRLRGLVQMAIDAGDLKYMKETGNILLKGQKWLAIPHDYQADRQPEYITGYLASPINEEQLLSFLTNTLTVEKIDEMDIPGLKWLCKLYGLDTKDKAPSLLKEEIKGKTGL
jgi:hypothetical protein